MRPEHLTRSELQGLRRWMIVAGVWAVAATVIALIALLDSARGDGEREAGEAAGRLAKLERRLGGRIDALERRLGELPRSNDISRLEERLGRVEDGVSAAAGAARRAGEDARDLEERIARLERRAPARASGGTRP